MDRARVDFRDIHVDTDGIDIGHDKQLLICAAVPSIHQRSYVNISADQNAREWRGHALKRFGLFQAADIGVCGGQAGCSLRIRTGSFIRLLCGNRIHFLKSLPALGGALR